jgi:hypothetical protein
LGWVGFLESSRWAHELEHRQHTRPEDLNGNSLMFRVEMFNDQLSSSSVRWETLARFPVFYDDLDHPALNIGSQELNVGVEH